jgi:hypothetical protein
VDANILDEVVVIKLKAGLEKGEVTVSCMVLGTTYGTT